MSALHEDRELKVDEYVTGLQDRADGNLTVPKVQRGRHRLFACSVYIVMSSLSK